MKDKNTINTLETPMWGKPTKRGFYWLQRKKIITTVNSEISYSPANSTCTALLFLAQLFRPYFFSPEFSTLLFHPNFFGPAKLSFLQLQIRPLPQPNRPLQLSTQCVLCPHPQSPFITLIHFSKSLLEAS
jgi:hypothetical protein